MSLFANGFNNYGWGRQIGLGGSANSLTGGGAWRFPGRAITSAHEAMPSGGAAKWSLPVKTPCPTLASQALSGLWLASFPGGVWMSGATTANSPFGKTFVPTTGLPAPAQGALYNGRRSADFKPFEPLSVAGCKVWYDLAQNTNAGGVVTALPDQSGNARNATIAGGSEPTYTASSAPFGNKPVMTFPPSDAKAVASPDLGITTGARTFVFVGDIGVTGANNMAFSDSGGTLWLRGNGTGLGIEVTPDGTVNIIADTAASTLSTPMVVIWVNNGASSKLYVSALTPTTGTTPILDMTGLSVTLGNYAAGPPGATWAQDGSTAQFLVYDSALSQADCEYLLEGFGAQHGITIGP